MRWNGRFPAMRRSRPNHCVSGCGHSRFARFGYVSPMRELRAVLFDLDDTLHDDTYAFTTAAEEVAREVAAEHGIDAIALKDAYVAEAEGFWHRLTGEQVKTKLSTVRATLWGNALTAVGLADPELT